MSYGSYFGYIEKLGGNGWLRVKFNHGLVWPLPEFLKIFVTASGSREEFKVLEGRFRGETASVKRKGWTWDDWDGSFFENDLREGYPYKKPAEMRFYRKSHRLEVEGIGLIHAKTDPENPVPIGRHDVEIPYEPHDWGRFYTGEARYAKTWFRVGHTGDRFLHCGNVSAGCITVKDIHRWDEIYRRLIVSRKDSKSIGTVEVVDR